MGQPQSTTNGATTRDCPFDPNLVGAILYGCPWYIIIWELPYQLSTNLPSRCVEKPQPLMPRLW